MPEKKTIQRARKDKREGKAPSTQAGEFVREEIEHVRQGKHGASNAKQPIAIGLSKARRAGVKLPPLPGAKPARGKKASSRVRRKAGRTAASTSSRPIAKKPSRTRASSAQRRNKGRRSTRGRTSRASRSPR